MIQYTRKYRWVTMLMVALFLVSNVGCVGGMAQLLYVIRGHKSPAQFKGLKGKKIAVVVVSDATSYGAGADTLTYTIGKAVSIELKRNVKDVTVVAPSQIEEWIDRNGIDSSSFVKIGQGVDAEMVVAVEIGAYTIHDGATLYKGQADLSVSVYDIANGAQVVYSNGPKDFVFPKNGRPAIQTSDRGFERLYLAKLTSHISKLFYAHDQLESVAEDAAMPAF